MSHQDPLSTLVTAFAQWRSTKNSRQATIPIALREQAVSLLNAYSSSKITSALNISGSQLKQWQHTIESSEKPALFVNLPVSKPLLSNAMTIELCFASGDQLRLNGIVENEVITTLIEAMKS